MQTKEKHRDRVTVDLDIRVTRTHLLRPRLMGDLVCDAYHMLMDALLNLLMACFLFSFLTFMVAGRKIAEYKWVYDASFGIGRPLRDEINSKCQQLRLAELEAVSTMDYDKAARLVHLTHTLRLQENRAKQFSNDEKDHVCAARYMEPDRFGCTSERETLYRRAKEARDQFNKAVAELVASLEQAMDEIEGRAPALAMGVPLALNQQH